MNVWRSARMTHFLALIPEMVQNAKQHVCVRSLVCLYRSLPRDVLLNTGEDGVGV